MPPEQSISLWDTLLPDEDSSACQQLLFLSSHSLSRCREPCHPAGQGFSNTGTGVGPGPPSPCSPGAHSRPRERGTTQSVKTGFPVVPMSAA